MNTKTKKYLTLGALLFVYFVSFQIILKKIFVLSGYHSSLPGTIIEIFSKEFIYPAVVFNYTVSIISGLILLRLFGEKFLKMFFKNEFNQRCRNCGTIVKGGRFCSKCGKEYSSIEKLKCLKCGTKFKKGDKFCKICGNKLESPEKNLKKEQTKGKISSPKKQVSKVAVPKNSKVSSNKTVPQTKKELNQSEEYKYAMEGLNERHPKLCGFVEGLYEGLKSGKIPNVNALKKVVKNNFTFDLFDGIDLDSNSEFDRMASNFIALKLIEIEVNCLANILNEYENKKFPEFQDLEQIHSLYSFIENHIKST